MEYMIKKIINIDKEAEKYKEANKSQFEDYKMAFENEMKSMKEKFENELNEEKKRMMDSSLKKAVEEAENIKNTNDEQYNQLMNLYLKLREKIAEEIFCELKNSMKEG